jgi:hypothetical protein
MPSVRAGCAVLPDDEILIVGSYDATYKRSAYTYNVDFDIWTKLPNTNFDQVRRFRPGFYGIGRA